MHFKYDDDIYIGVKQLSEYLIGSYYVSLDGQYTYLSRDERETTLYFTNERLVKKPGYEVIMTNIDDIHFEINEPYLFINITRDDKSYRFLISYIQEKQDEKYRLNCTFFTGIYRGCPPA